MEEIAIVLLFTVAFLYGSVGHGGASGYIAVFSLFGMALSTYKPLVLLLNIIISGTAFIQFSKVGYLKWSLILPFLVTSIPFAYWGAKFTMKLENYHLMLGLALIFPVLRLIRTAPSEQRLKKELPYITALLIGAALGFASGLLNIGGGIFLSPILILMGWASAKESAAASAFFILCNSLAGMAAIKNQTFFADHLSIECFFAVVTGGVLGAYFGSNLYKQTTIRYVLASVISIASVKLLFFMR